MAKAPPPSDRRTTHSSRLRINMLGSIRSDQVDEVCSLAPNFVPPNHFLTIICRIGDKHKTNRMFRRRIYAQGFTILAMVGGSAYWESDRAKRKQYEGLLDDKKRQEKRDAWIKELEARDAEEEELRRMRDRMIRGRGAEEKGLTESQAEAVEGRIKDGRSVVQSVLEKGEGRGEGPIVRAAQLLWRGSRST